MTIREKKEIILKYLQNNPWLNNTQIARKIIKESKKFSSDEVDNLRRAIGKVRNKIEDIEIVATEELPKYIVQDGNYYWENKNGKISLSVEFIDSLFYEYSEYGLNLTQTEVINKYNLQVWEWNSIKSTLWLFKKSNIFSPYTVENTPVDQLEGMIAAKISGMLNNTGLQVEKQYNKELNKKYKEIIKKQTVQDITLQTMILELSDLIPACEVKPHIRVNKSGEGVLNIFLFDIHFGAQNRTDYSPLYSPEVVKELLFKIATTINSYNGKEINIFFGGDCIEAFTGENHRGSWKGIARGYYGSKLIIELYKLLVEFLSQINNLKAVFAVPGNHDRATEKNDIDTEGAMAEILFELIKLSFQDNIIFQYDEKLISKSIDGLHFIMTHGHFKISDNNPAELILRFGNPSAFNILVSGHWHERRIKKDHELFRQIVCPPLFPGNDYSVNLGYTAAPGFLIIKNNGYNNKPLVIDYAL